MQTVNYNAIRKNALFFNDMLSPSKLCAVIKNDAYGHGIEDTARAIFDVAGCFAVGSVAEAQKIDFVNKDILVLLPLNVEDCTHAVENGYILTVDSFDTLDVVQHVCASLDKTARVHIKIDSGMSRLGFSIAQIDELVIRLNTNKQIDVCGAFSHFWGETKQSCDGQLRVFNRAASLLQNGLGKTLTKHIANTSATLLSSAYRLDMARVGLGLFGYGAEQLVPAKTVTCRVVAVKQVDKGDVVGYGGKFVCEREGKIAVINCGYANGLNRVLRGQKVALNGRLYEIAAICMAMSMLYIGEDDVSVGDEVTLLGNGVNVSNDEMIIYELLCNLR